MLCGREILCLNWGCLRKYLHDITSSFFVAAVVGRDRWMKHPSYCMYIQYVCSVWAVTVEMEGIHGGEEVWAYFLLILEDRICDPGAT